MNLEGGNSICVCVYHSKRKKKQEDKGNFCRVSLVEEKKKKSRSLWRSPTSWYLSAQIVTESGTP